MNSQEEIVKKKISLTPSARSQQATGSVNQISSTYISKHLLYIENYMGELQTEMKQSLVTATPSQG